MKDDIRPYAVISTDGEILSLLQTNEKGYRKSIENNQIWAVTSDTERLLPEEISGRITGFREKSGWYEVVVDTGAVKPAGKEAAAGVSGEERVPGRADSGIIERLYRIIEQRKKELPEGSYTTHLFNSGISKIRKKTGEEAIELLLAEERGEIVYESADLIYHMLVLLAAAEIKPSEIFKELESRE